MRLIVALVIILLCQQGWSQTGQMISGKTEQTKTLSAYFAEELKVLSHDSMEGRGTLSRGIRRAEKHIVSELKAMGINTLADHPDYLQDVPLVKSSIPKKLEIHSESEVLLDDQDMMVISGKEINIKASGSFVSLGQTDDLKDKILEGKWVIAIVGNSKDPNPGTWLATGKEKARICRQSGAVGLIEIFQPGKMPWAMFKSFQGRNTMKLAEEGFDFPHLWVNATDSTVLSYLTSQDPTLRVLIDGMDLETQNDHNIIAYIPGTDKTLENEMIVFSAHYDHVGIGKPDASGDNIYNGARDNAVGVATLLALSQHFIEVGSPRPLLFVFFTAEERGLLGSKYFVDHCPVPLEDIRFNFNCDNGGYTDTDMISIVGFHRIDGWNNIDELLKAEGMKHYEPVALAKRLFYASDNINFAQKGIPAPSISMGFTGMTTKVLKYYHQAGDHWENFDRSYMDSYWNGIVTIAVNLVGQQELPYWKKSDPLFEKANLLYRNREVQHK